MHPATPPTSEPTQPDPQTDRRIRFLPKHLSAVLHVVRVLLAYGRRFAETAEPRARHIQFATIAAAFGTEKLDTILRRVERGILRAIALERYLIARAAKNRDLATFKRRIAGQPVGFTDPPASDTPQQAEPTQSKRKRRRPLPDWRSALDPDHPANFCVYTMEELEQQVRRWPVGRTIVEICNDLGVIPPFCTGELWADIYNALWWYGGSFNTMWEARKRREKAFEQERYGRPDAWDWDWRDTRQERVRRALGCLIGEAPMLDPPDSLPAPAPA